jgi:hypothetical protein
VGGIFISYRRGDSEGQARALSLELAKYVGDKGVFMDVDSIALGSDFRRSLHESLESCDAALALIGHNWLDSKDAAGRRRLDDPSDIVRLEIATALKRNIPVTPVLLQGASMPTEQVLPDDLKELAFRNGFELSHARWHSDVREMAQRLGLCSADAFLADAQAKGASRKASIAWPDDGDSSWRSAERPSRGGGELSLADQAESVGSFHGCRGCSGLGNRRALHSAMDAEPGEAGTENGCLQFRDCRRKGSADADGQSQRIDLYRDAQFWRRNGYGVDPRRRVRYGLAEVRAETSFQRGSATHGYPRFILHRRVAGNAGPVGGRGVGAPH